MENLKSKLVGFSLPSSPFSVKSPETATYKEFYLNVQHKAKLKKQEIVSLTCCLILENGWIGRF